MLDYFGISYNIVEVNPVLRTQLKWSENYKKVPILIVETSEGEVLQLNDSSMIISSLYSFLESQKNLGTASGVKKENQSSMLHIANCYPSIKFTVCSCPGPELYQLLTYQLNYYSIISILY